jgi:hypothetical protein
VIAVVFTCGCQSTITGQEQGKPVCPIHGTPIQRIASHPPKVTGTCQSPLKMS